MKGVYIPESDIRLVRCRPFSDVYKARLHDFQVCVELIRWPADLTDDDLVKAAHERILVELNSWSRLDHPNIMPFIGYCNGIRGPLIGLALEWMTAGRMLQYLEKHPDADCLSLLTGCAEGFRYLHCCGVVHGDLTCDNVLISLTNSVPRPLLYGFGIPKVIDDYAYDALLLKRKEVILPPELAKLAMATPSISNCFTTASDVWAFGI